MTIITRSKKNCVYPENTDILKLVIDTDLQYEVIDKPPTSPFAIQFKKRISDFLGDINYLNNISTYLIKTRDSLSPNNPSTKREIFNYNKHLQNNYYDQLNIVCELFSMIANDYTSVVKYSPFYKDTGFPNSVYMKIHELLPLVSRNFDMGEPTNEMEYCLLEKVKHYLLSANTVIIPYLGFEVEPITRPNKKEAINEYLDTDEFDERTDSSSDYAITITSDDDLYVNIV